MSKKKKTNKNSTIAKKIDITDENINLEIDNKVTAKKKKNYLGGILLIFMTILSILYFILSLYKFDSLNSVISGLLILLFSLLLVGSISGNLIYKKKTKLFMILIFIIYLGFGICTSCGLINFSIIKVMDDLVGKSLTKAIEWSTDNNITLNQDYEYSDIVDEYHIIYQDVKVGTKLKNIKSVNVLVSEGPNPDKEIVIPNMLGYDCCDVLEFIKKNYLTNVVIEFIQSSDKVNSLIEQSKSGNVRRNEEIKFVFSYGEERDYTEVKMRNLKNKSKIEALFYLKEYGIKYEISYDFSDKVKRGNVISQSVKPGTVVKISGDDASVVKIVISKGKKIVVPDLKKMSVTDITNWIIKNKLKVEFMDSYDESVKENSVISASHNKDDVVEEGDVITVTLSKGKLKMPDFKNLNEFREWADKYNISYQEEHEFSDDVSIGEVIKYSYNKGDTIKNNDTIIVTISDGKKVTVPSVKGLSKADATSKLKNSDLRYSFIYKYSSSVEKGKVINQSISAGSSVSSGTTITVTISNGKAPASSSNGNNSNKGNNTSTPTCDRSKTAVFWLQTGNTGSQTLSATKNGNPGFTIYGNLVDSCSNGDSSSGTVCNASAYDGKTLSLCDSISLTIVK